MHLQNFIPYLLFFVGLVTLLTGLVVISRDFRKIQNILFLAFAGSLAFWVIAIGGFIVTDADSRALVWSKAYYLAGLLIALTMPLFAKTFPDNSKIPLKWWFGSLFAFLLVALPLVFSREFLTQSIVYHDWGKEVIINKVHYLLYSVYLMGAFIFGLSYSFYKLRQKKGYERSQIRLFFVGFLLNSGFGTLFNLFFPWFGNYRYIWLGPLFTNALIFAVGYGMIKHRLFDIRPIVVRSLGYVITISIMVTAFAFFSILFVRQIFEGDPNGLGPVILNTAIFILAVITYPILKRYFDHLTNRFFFRDAYDPQEFLDQLNKSIVSNIEIGILLRRTTAIIQENIKSSFLQIVIPKTESTEERIVGTVDGKYSDHEINYMRGRLVGLGRKIVTVEDLGPDEDELQKIFNKHDIAVLVHLSASSYGQSQTIAYMIFGSKKSGNIYSKADLKIIEIIADELVIAIQNALRFEEIQDFNVTLQNKVNTATNKLRRTNEKLKAMDETKDEFISMASHQLRTPLTSVKGYLSMVLEGDAGEINDTQRKLLDQAFVSSQRMVYLIADLLNVSRLRTGKFIIDAHPANLADMVEGEISQLVGQARAKGITFTFEKPDDFPDLLIDETKTRQVIMNFVDNALFYTPSDGRIEIELSQDKGHVYFQVKDNGLGVPKDEQKHLFTKFYRAKNARNIRPDGTGLGLFMAKKVITAQGGNILFSSTEGKGSTFGFSFNKKHLALDRPAEEAGLGDSD